MKASIITIGNSKGIRIPKPLLEESGLGSTVDISVKKGEIVIKKAKPIVKTIIPINDEYLLSLRSLSEWDTPEEDSAWAYLQ